MIILGLPICENWCNLFYTVLQFDTVFIYYNKKAQKTWPTSEQTAIKNRGARKYVFNGVPPLNRNTFEKVFFIIY